MSEIIIGTVLLYCGQGSSNKEYQVEVYRDPADPTATKKLRGKYGPAGKLSQSKEYGNYSLSEARKLITSKTAKSYEITRVNSKPFTSGSLADCMILLDNGNDWNATSTAQPTPKVKAREVEVTFDEGQCAPIW